TRFLSDRRATRPPICRTSGPDSRLRGNDGGAVSVAPDKFLKLKIPSFPQDSHKDRKPKTET
ncbi:TPA: hypothetical protein ACKJ88_002180, partial [Neisseria gonorrhoeae]